MLQHHEERFHESMLAKEALHWSSYTEQALKRGIPTWVDLRNATPLRGFAHIFGDPVTEHILRGEYKEKLIRAATSKPGRVLDLGCGAGWLSLELARRGMQVHAIDISPGQIQIARDYLRLIQEKEQQLDITYEVGDLSSVSLESHGYVAIVSWDSIHHVPNLEHLFNELKNALMPRGTIVAFEHVGGPLESLRELAARFLGKPRSPFEDAGAHQLADMFHRHFSVKREQRVLSVAVLLSQAFQIYRLPIGKASTLRAFRVIDHILLRSRLLPGEYIFIEATRA